MPAYSLDVVYSSSVNPAVSQQNNPITPIVMAYGFACSMSTQTGKFAEDGQKAEIVAKNSSFQFNVVDTDSNASQTTILDILITFSGISGQGPGSPLVDSNGNVVNEIHVVGPITPQYVTSYGCNVTGYGWSSSQQGLTYTAQNVGNFECIVYVTVQLSANNSNKKVYFQVDPEIDVEAAG